MLLSFRLQICLDNSVSLQYFLCLKDLVNTITNTIKLSYCCTTNLTGIIRQHNAKVLNATKTPNEARLCNCRNKQSCPLDGKCLSSSIVYRAEVTSDNNTKIYYGASEGEFKTRYNNHTKTTLNPTSNLETQVQFSAEPHFHSCNQLSRFLSSIYY